MSSGLREAALVVQKPYRPVPVPVPAPVQYTGALSAGFITILRILAKQARLPGATDLTQYGEGRASPKAFLTHHVANISTAVQAADAHTVLNAATSRAQRLSHGFA